MESVVLSLPILEKLAEDTQNTIEAELDIKLDAIVKEQKEQRKKELAEEKAKDKIKIEKWLNHENPGGYISRDTIYLRISKDKKDVETSNGASIPVSHALILWNRLQKNKEVTGLALGYFKVKSLTEKILQVGCTSIPLPEIEKIARKLNL